MSDIDPNPPAELDTPGATQEPENIAEADKSSEELLSLKSENESMAKELADLKDQYLRFRADADNYRKRIQKEREEDRKTANTQLLGDLIGVLDDFERAIKSSANTKDFDSFHSGVVMIEQQMVNLLEKKYGLKRFESVGSEFNPEHHEAIMMLPSETNDAEMLVVEEFQKGYHLHDKVLRAAKVKVGPKAKDNVNEQ